MDRDTRATLEASLDRIIQAKHRLDEAERFLRHAIDALTSPPVIHRARLDVGEDAA